MEAPRRYGFDPNSPGAQHLLRGSHARELVEIELIRRMTPEQARQLDPKLLPGRTYEPGDRMTLQRHMADRVIAAGFASRFAGAS
jgi:hypothetical protein